MIRLFYKCPEAIGEELKAQITYCKNIGIIKNNEELSLKMREIEEEIFGKERNYRTLEERENNIPKDRTIQNIRAGTITDLCRITLNKEIPNYLLLFSAFKVLNIVKEDENIVKLLDYYNIKPKKKVDKDRLKFLDINKEKNYLSMCCQCRKVTNKKCENCKKCLFLKIKNAIDKTVEEDEKIKLLYKLGFPSNFIDVLIHSNSTSYTISVKTLKNILEYLKMFNELEYIEDSEEKYEKIFLKMIRESRDEWEAEIEKEYEKLEKIKNIETIEELQEKRQIENTLATYRKFLYEGTDEQLKKRRLYYLDNIEDICYMKSKFPQKTIH